MPIQYTNLSIPSIFSVLARSCRRNILMESWAEGVETVVTNDRYDRFDNSYFRDTRTDYDGWNLDKQEESPDKMDEYTPIVIDLIDVHNQNTVDDNYPNDEVNGYTLRQIQDALNQSRSFSTWRNKLNANRPLGVTTYELTEIFSYMDVARQNQRTCD
nr:hypothetical protein [uncultured Allomuricauda sp.]